ncbi:MAG: cell division topological specificity factor MinE [Anaerolineales bacterium]|jgi:cell division topological specificity factor|nr:cell division topological specificity factor MinE [Anaerolineales bacterium]
MSGFFDRLLGRDQKSASLAKERMKLVLIHDRTDLSPRALDELKDELIQVISRHIEIDPDSVQINMAQDGRQQRLIADIPLRQVPHRR